MGVSRTRAEQNEYSRGYGRGIRRASDRVRQVLEIARGYKARAAGDSAGRCSTCERWKRGRVGEASCLWGVCRADFEHFAGEGSMWIDNYPRPSSERGEICTHETFGCVNWIPALNRKS
jgi:hypothetical protein